MRGDVTALRRLGWWAEASLVAAVLGLVSLLPPAWSARLVGGVAAAIGPWLPVSRVADRNMRLALPALDRPARRRLIRQTWFHLGCTMGEYPHLAALHESAGGVGWQIDPASRAILQAQVAKGGPAILFSGHLGNWEMLPAICAAHGISVSSAYRPPANPVIDRLLRRLRRRALGRQVTMFPKGRIGARAATGHLAQGGYLGLLMDQKMNDGIETTLFGHPAMTAPALATLAFRYRCPVIPGVIVRLGPGRLRLIVEPPLAFPDSGDRKDDIALLTQQVNACLERWISAAPADWLWFHRRWPKAFYRND